MNHQAVEQHMQRAYDAIACRYREDDEQEITTSNHCRICNLLTSICQSFGRPINVLEIGCGTGRYFYCLRNVRCLTGMDVSRAMLQEAQHPVRENSLQIAETNLALGNVYSAVFPPGSFDFIYSLGVFGNGCSLNPKLINKFYDWLSPDGTLYFDTIDITSISRPARIRMKVRNLIHASLPMNLQDRWNQRAGWLPFYMADQKSTLKMLRKTRFDRFAVERVICHLTLGLGAKIECIATRGETLATIPQNKEFVSMR